jgi:exonuclease VII small subunit
VLKTTNVAYTATRDNLASTSKDLDDAMIREQEANKLLEQAEARLADAEKRLVVADGENKNQGLLLETARQALSKREDSSVPMISTGVTNAMPLLKSHLPDLDVELLRKYFAVDEVEREVLSNDAYDAAHEFASSYDFF